MARHGENRIEITAEVPTNDYPAGIFEMNEKT